MKVVLVTLWILLLAGCASNQLILFDIYELEDQQTLYNDGKPIVISTKSNMVAISSGVEPIAAEHNFISLNVIFLNTTDSPISVDPSLIRIKSNDDQSLKVLTDSEHKIALDDLYRSQRIGLALQGFGASTSSSQTAYHSGTVGGDVYSGTTQYEVDNSGGVQRVQSAKKELELRINGKKDFYIRRHTVMPQKEYVGRLWIENSQEEITGSREIIVPFGGEIHRFVLGLSSSNK